MSAPDIAAPQGSTPDLDGTIVVAVNLDGDRVGTGWGKARSVAIATVEDGRLVEWLVNEVRWDIAHDQGTEGSHHARVVRFLREHHVDAVVTGHMGAPMANMLGKLGITAFVNVEGDAEQAAIVIAEEMELRRAEGD